MPQFPAGFTPDPAPTPQFPPGFTPDEPKPNAAAAPPKKAGPFPLPGDAPVPKKEGEKSPFPLPGDQPLEPPKTPKQVFSEIFSRPYGMQEVIQGYRTYDQQGTAGLNDHQVWAKFAVNFPELAKGVTELTRPLRSETVRGFPGITYGVESSIYTGMGAVDFLKNAPAAIANLARPFYLAGTGQPIEGYQQAKELVKSGAGGIYENVKTPVLQGTELVTKRNVGAPSPDDPRTREAQKFAGANLAATLAPEVIPPVVGAAVRLPGAAVEFLTRADLVPEAVNNWMGLTARDVGRGATNLNPGARLLREGLVGENISKAQALTNVGNAMTETGTQMDRVLQRATAAGKEVDLQTPIYDAWGKASKRIGRSSEPAFAKAIQQVVDDLEGEIPGANLAKLTPEQAQKIAIRLGEDIRRTGAAAEDPVNQMMLSMEDGIRANLNREVPALQPLNERWADLRLAREGIREEISKDVVNRGTGPGGPQRPPRPATEFAKGHVKHAIGAAGLGVGAGGIYELIDYLRGRK